MNQDILINLLQEKENVTSIVKEFPGLYSACISIKQNISNETTEKSVAKILNLYETNEKFKIKLDSLLKDSPDANVDENNVAGMVLTISKNEDAYVKLLETAKKEKWAYKGISIVPDFNTLRLYFY